MALVAEATSSYSNASKSNSDSGIRRSRNRKNKSTSKHGVMTLEVERMVGILIKLKENIPVVVIEAM